MLLATELEEGLTELEDELEDLTELEEEDLIELETTELDEETVTELAELLVVVEQMLPVTAGRSWEPPLVVTCIPNSTLWPGCIVPFHPMSLAL